MSGDTVGEIASQSRMRMRLIWLAASAAIGLYVVVAYAVTGGGGAESEEPARAIVFACYGQSLLLGVGSLGYRRWALSDARLRQAMAGEEQPGRAGEDVLESGLVRVLAQLQMVDIVGLALHEAIAIFGLVLAILTGQAQAVLPFAAFATLLNLAVLPRPDAVVERAERLAMLPTSSR